MMTNDGSKNTAPFSVAAAVIAVAAKLTVASVTSATGAAAGHWFALSGLSIVAHEQLVATAIDARHANRTPQSQHIMRKRDDGTYVLGQSTTDGAGLCGSTIVRGRWTQEGDTIVLAKEAWRRGGEDEWTASVESKTATIDGDDLRLDGERWSRSR